MFEKIAIIADEKNPRAVEFQKKLWASSGKVIFIPQDADLIAAAGGDGFLMKTIHKYHELQKPFFGLNFGHKGYLLNEVKKISTEDLFTKEISIFNFPIFEFWGKDTSGNKFKGVFMGDLYFNRVTEESGESCRLNISINGRKIVENMTGDGVVVCSALGSTAYFFNAGGPALHPLLPVLGIAPLLAAPDHAKLVLPNSVEILIQAVEPDKRRVVVTNDNVDLHKNILWVKIRRFGALFALGFWEDHDFIETIVKKILKKG